MSWPCLLQKLWTQQTATFSEHTNTTAHLREFDDTFRQLAQVSGIVQAPVIDTFFIICFIPTSECACVPGDRAWQHARRVNENNLVFINSDTSFIQKSPRNYLFRKPVGTSFAIISSFELSFTFPFLSAFRWNKNEAEQFHFCFRSVATFF